MSHGKWSHNQRRMELWEYEILQHTTRLWYASSWQRLYNRRKPRVIIGLHVDTARRKSLGLLTVKILLSREVSEPSYGWLWRLPNVSMGMARELPSGMTSGSTAVGS